MMEKGDWTSVCEEFHGQDEYREPLLLWVRPTPACLRWIEQELLSLGIDQVSSVGCGCGTLEWLLKKATKLTVTGYEVNRGWWESPYSTPHFIDLVYVDQIPGQYITLPKDSALLFCYFNNLELFHKYLENYAGSCIILIGPRDNERHCEPAPRYLEEQCSDIWRLHASFPMTGGDEIAIYVRRGILTSQ